MTKKITPRWAPVDDLKGPSQVVLLKNISCQHRPRQSGNYAVAVNLKLALVGYNTALKELLMMMMMMAIVQWWLREISTLLIQRP